MPPNTAAYLPSAKARLTLLPTERRYPDETEIVVRTSAVAINQIDWKIQFAPWTEFPYPLVLGEDVAGTVVETGSCVTRFKRGDRVIGHAVGIFSGDERHGAFQEFVVLEENMACVFPASIGFEKGVVLPLGVSTASAALFAKKGEQGLGLPRPELEPVKNGGTVLVWGGTTSVGSNAIQLAVASGCEVVATAGAKNFEYARRLGAATVVDYKSKTVVQDVVAAFQGRRLVGAFDTVGSEDSKKATVAVVEQVEGEKIAATVDEFEDLPEGIMGVGVMAVSIRENEVSEMVYGDYLPKALAAGKYQTAPDPYIAGIGLGAIQGAFEAQKKASARKVVVTIF
ncbi:GroES-like protein [Aspergillus pseudoustus]|uniref:GroES-like protein n=1 Tax=Aspergillus pseudoustus TaxID=1810923 RepID=A0ABR4JPJ2_9EURO